MISEIFSGDVFIADYSNYVGRSGYESIQSKGVVVETEDNGIIPSFIIQNPNSCQLRVVNNEHNPAAFKRSDGSMVSQCECIVYAERNDNRKGWLFFLELKYCEAKNRYARMQEGIDQLKNTCNHIFKEKRVFEADLFNKKYLVISTPGIEPHNPFDAFEFDQDFILKVKKETGALLKAANKVLIKTPSVLDFNDY